MNGRAYSSPGGALSTCCLFDVRECLDSRRWTSARGFVSLGV